MTHQILLYLNISSNTNCETNTCKTAFKHVALEARHTSSVFSTLRSIIHGFHLPLMYVAPLTQTAGKTLTFFGVCRLASGASRIKPGLIITKVAHLYRNEIQLSGSANKSSNCLPQLLQQDKYTLSAAQLCNYHIFLWKSRVLFVVVP